MTLTRTCRHLFSLSARHAHGIVAPLLEHVPDLETRERVAFRVVESTRGVFVFGTLLVWDPVKDLGGAVRGMHAGVDAESSAPGALGVFLEMVLDRARSGLLVHDGAENLLALLSRHRDLPEARALVPHVERALDLAVVFDALQPGRDSTLETMGARIAGIPRKVCGLGLSKRAADIDAPKELRRIANSCGDPYQAWDQVLSLPASKWADEWVIDESPVWGELLEEDGELRTGRLRELDRWLLEEVVAVANRTRAN